MIADAGAAAFEVEVREDRVSGGVEIVLPTDIVAADEFSADSAHEVVAADAIPADKMGLDIGPESAKLFADKVAAYSDGSVTVQVFNSGTLGNERQLQEGVR